MSKLKDIYVAEYSSQQGCFHIEDVNTMLIKNRSMIVKGMQYPDYVPFFIGTLDECHIACARAEAQAKEYGFKLIGDAFPNRTSKEVAERDTVIKEMRSKYGLSDIPIQVKETS